MARSLIPDPLPVGVSRVMLRPGKRKQRMPARPFYNANVSIDGAQKAKHFSVDRLGEEGAFFAARLWRLKMLQNILKEKARRGEKPHGLMNRPGTRKPHVKNK